MSLVSIRSSITRIGLLQIGIIVLTVITAFIHLQKGIAMGSMSHSMGGHGGPGGYGGSGGPQGGGQGGPGGSGGAPGRGPGGGGGITSALPLPLSTLFILNGVGYIVLLIGLYLPFLRRYQRIIRWLLIIFAAVTIIAYFAIAGIRFNLEGYIDKLIEVALIVLLLVEEWQVTRRGRELPKA